MNANHGAEQYPYIVLPDGSTAPIAPPPQRRQRRPENFVMAFQDAIVALATHDDLRPTDVKLALYLAGHADYENWVTTTPTQAAMALKVDRSAIYHGMRRLREAGILENVEPKEGHRAGWRFAPTFLWRGKVKNLHDERKRRLQAVTNEKEPTT